MDAALTAIPQPRGLTSTAAREWWFIPGAQNVLEPSMDVVLMGQWLHWDQMGKAVTILPLKTAISLSLVCSRLIVT